MSEHDDNNSDKSDERLVRRAKQLFDDSVDGLDAHTRSCLNQRRQHAMAALVPDRADGRRIWWLPAAGVVAAAAAIFLLDRHQTTVPPVPSTVAADFELLMDETSLEMLEDLEFYSWIDLESTDTSTPDENVG